MQIHIGRGGQHSGSGQEAQTFARGEVLDFPCKIGKTQAQEDDTPVSCPLAPMSDVLRLSDLRRSKRVFFTRPELNQLLSLYTRQVMRGEWRDYAIDQRDGAVLFSMFRRTQELPIFTVMKTAPGTNRRGDDYDQRVKLRIARGAEMNAADYVKLIEDRACFIAAVDARVEGCDALIVPTVAVVAPPIATFAEDADFYRLNAKILRNPNVVNFLDRCAITLPVSRLGEAPVGLMLIGTHGGDRRLLAMAQGIEATLAAA